MDEVAKYGWESGSHFSNSLKIRSELYFSCCGRWKWQRWKESALAKERRLRIVVCALRIWERGKWCHRQSGRFTYRVTVNSNSVRTDLTTPAFNDSHDHFSTLEKNWQVDPIRRVQCLANHPPKLLLMALKKLDTQNITKSRASSTFRMSIPNGQGLTNRTEQNCSNIYTKNHYLSHQLRAKQRQTSLPFHWDLSFPDCPMIGHLRRSVTFYVISQQHS
jgi:hypothetical protein